MSTGESLVLKRFQALDFASLSLKINAYACVYAKLRA